MSPPVVSAADVRVRLGGRHVLDGLALDVGPGEWLGIIGPNGAGKSTLLRALGGLVPASGSIVLGGEAIERLRPRQRARKVAIVAQNPVVPVGIRVADYVLLGRTPHRSPLAADGPADHRVVGEVLHRLDLTDLADRVVDTLSGGERQRVLIGRALAQQTPALLLDEPTTALDVGHQQDVLDLIDGLRREERLGVVTTLHDLTIAARYPDRLLLIVDGRAVAEGPPEAVVTEEHLARCYGARVRVVRDDDGGLLVIPRRRPAAGGAAVDALATVDR